MAELPDAPWVKQQDLPDAPWVQQKAEEDPSPPTGFINRVAGGWRNVWHDTGEMFKGGVETAAEAPGQIVGASPPAGFEDLTQDIHKKLMSAGASKDEADRQTEHVMRNLQRQQGMAGLVGGPIRALLSPLFGSFRSFVSRPVEEEYGVPKDVTETMAMAGLAVAGMRPGAPPHTVARVRVGPEGVDVQPIGEMPKAADFKRSAEILGGDHTEANLRAAWDEQGIHPAEAVHDAQRDAFVKHDLTAKPTEAVIDKADAEVLLHNGEMPLRGLGAEVTTEPPNVPLSQQPPAPPGRLMTAAHDAAEKLYDIGRDVQMKLSPMTTGTRDTMAMVKDFANTLRRNRWDWSRIDDDIAKRFDPEQRKRMWDAADEESVLRQEGKESEHMGVATLTPEERAAVEQEHVRAQTAWLRVRDLGMVEGEGLPAYTPRMVINTASALADDKALPLNGIGRNLRVRTAQMMHRKYLTAEETEAAAKARFGEQAEIARDIRVLPLATAQLEDAAAGRTLINNIKEYGKRTGIDTTVEGAIPVGSETKWFTLDHPAFRTWRPKFEEVDGKMQAMKDADGHAIFEQVPIYVHGDFEGPLRAVLTQKSGPIYSALMGLKAKTMSLIMNSPMIHNAVEFGRAFPAMPIRIFTAYKRGNLAKNDVSVMHEAIDNGLVPIGHRFFNQDITSIMEAPDLTPGRSVTAKLSGLVPGLFDEGAEMAVKRSIDKAGDFWHNTMLWDRIADLQMGLYVNLRGDMTAKGVDPQTSSRVAAHFANRYAGALPKEAMSDGATKFANFLMFSRSFTMGNLGVMKDALTGLPKDVMAQIERDMGTVDPKAVSYAKSLARRKAFVVIAADIGLLYAANSVLQNALNVMLMDSSIDEEMHGYARRAKEAFAKIEAHPLEMTQYLSLAADISATADNEPGKQDRLKIGYAKDGTAIYARSPFGKIGEEFTGYFTGPIDMLKRKEGTLARPMLQVIENDKGFGRKIYDPDAHTTLDRANVVWEIVKHFFKSQTPEGQVTAGLDLIKGEGDSKVNALQTFGPLAGVTFSKGAPGGPAVGEMYHAKTQHDFAVQMALPDIRKQIQRGDEAGARERMTALGVPAGLQKFYVRTTMFPETRLGGRTLRDFYLYATPEQKARMERAQ